MEGSLPLSQLWMIWDGHCSSLVPLWWETAVPISPVKRKWNGRCLMLSKMLCSSILCSSIFAFNTFHSLPICYNCSSNSLISWVVANTQAGFNCLSLKCRQEKSHIQLQQTGCFLSNFSQLSQTVTLRYFFLQYRHDTFYWVTPGMIGAVQLAQRKWKSSSSTTFWHT